MIAGLSEAAQQACVAAASSGHDQVLEFLLDMSEVDVNRQDTLTGETGLYDKRFSFKKSY